MFHRATCTTVLASALLLSSAAGHTEAPGAAHARGRGRAATARHFEVYFGPGGKFAQPTAKFVERSVLFVPADWVEALRARTADRSDLRWFSRSELIKPGMYSGLAWDAGAALVGDMTNDERREYGRTLPPASRSAGLPSGMALPRDVRVTASFPIAVKIRQRDPRLDQILVVKSAFPQAPLPPRFVPFGGTVKATPQQIAFLMTSFGARDFEGDKGDLRFTLAAEHLTAFAAWLGGPEGPSDTPLREAREEFGEFRLLKPQEISDLYAAQGASPYRGLVGEGPRAHH
jgi:hypothetical protein